MGKECQRDGRGYFGRRQEKDKGKSSFTIDIGKRLRM